MPKDKLTIDVLKEKMSQRVEELIDLYREQKNDAVSRTITLSKVSELLIWLELIIEKENTNGD